MVPEPPLQAEEGASGEGLGRRATALAPSDRRAGVGAGWQAVSVVYAVTHEVAPGVGRHARRRHVYAKPELRQHELVERRAAATEPHYVTSAAAIQHGGESHVHVQHGGGERQFLRSRGWPAAQWEHNCQSGV